jgi:hypothetical protein
MKRQFVAAFVAGLSIFLASPLLAASPSTYVIPVAAREVQGYAAQWSSSLIFFNPTEQDVVLRLIHALPLGASCTDCPTSWTVPPKGRVSPQFSSGAAVLEATGPLAVQHEMRAFDSSQNRSSFQFIPTFDRLIASGRLVSFAGVAPYGGINLFVANPNDFPVTVETWVYEAIDPTTKFAEIPPGQTRLVSLNDYRCALSPDCIFVGFPPSGSFTVGFRANGDVSAIMSIVSGLGDAYVIPPHVMPAGE